MYTTDIFTITDDIIIAHYKTAMHPKKGEYIITALYSGQDHYILSHYSFLQPTYYQHYGTHRVKYTLHLKTFLQLLQALKEDWYTTDEDSRFYDDCYGLYSDMLYTIGIELV